VTDDPDRVGVASVATFAWIAPDASAERLRRDEEGPPARSWEPPRQGGEDRPIDRSVAHTPVYLAIEDAHLVAEHHELDVLVELISA